MFVFSEAHTTINPSVRLVTPSRQAKPTPVYIDEGKTLLLDLALSRISFFDRCGVCTVLLLTLLLNSRSGHK